MLASDSIQQAIFFPQCRSFKSPFHVSVDSTSLACCFKAKLGAGKTIVFFHGNGECVADYADILPKALGLADCNVFLAEYRGYGMSGGTATLYNLVADVRSIIEAIPCGVENMIFWGRSLGSLPAINAASLHPNAHGLILESGIPDVFRYLRSRVPILEHDASTFSTLRKLCLAKFPHRRMLRNFRGAALLAHAVHDRHVPISASEELSEMLLCRRRFLRFQYGDHNSIFFANATAYVQAIYDLAYPIDSGETSVSN